MYTNCLFFVTQHNFHVLLDATTLVVSVVTSNKTTHQPIIQAMNKKFKLFVRHCFREGKYVIMPFFLCYKAVLSKVNMRTSVLCYV